MFHSELCGAIYARFSGFKFSIGRHLSGFLGARKSDDRKSGPSLPVAGDTAFFAIRACNSASKASLFAKSFGTGVILPPPPWGGGLTIPPCNHSPLCLGPKSLPELISTL